MPATVAPIAESDIADVAAFLARQTRAGEAIANVSMTPERRLRWLLLENPYRTDDIPLGWRIRDDAEAVVGAAVCIPFRIGAGEFRTTALMFAKFFVDAEYRGMGLGIFMRFVREGARFPLFSTSTNEKSGELFSRLGGAGIARMDHTMLGIGGPRPLIEEWLYRRTNRPALARVLSMPAAWRMSRTLSRLRNQGGESQLRRLRNADEAAAVSLPAVSDSVSVVRDRDYFNWRYFCGERENHVYCFHRKSDRDRLVIVEEIRSGYRGQIRVLNVLDIWPPATPECAVPLAAALADKYHARFDAIWLRSQSAATEDALQAVGFMKHGFPAPLGWFIDKENRLPTKDWYLMPGESE